MDKTRKTARAVIINDFDEVLLVKYEDREPVNPKQPELLAYWVPPGGELAAGESHEDAARREVREELGIDIVVGSCVWIRQQELRFGGRLRLVMERYFIARYQGRRVYLTSNPAEGIVSCRWWSMEAMARTEETLLPAGIHPLVRPLLQDECPETPIVID